MGDAADIAGERVLSLLALLAALAALSPEGRAPVVFGLPGDDRLWCAVRAAPQRAMVCVARDTGAVTGATLRRSGAPQCAIVGTFDGTCLHVTVCGRAHMACGPA